MQGLPPLWGDDQVGEVTILNCGGVHCAMGDTTSGGTQDMLLVSTGLCLVRKTLGHVDVFLNVLQWQFLEQCSGSISLGAAHIMGTPEA